MFVFNTNLFILSLVYGSLLGIAIFALRQTIDQVRDVLAEVLLTAAIVAGFCLPRFFRLELLCLLIACVIIWRFAERLGQQRQLHTGDLFRLTTAAALWAFAAAPGNYHLHQINIFTILGIYMIGELGQRHRNPTRYCSIAFASGFLASSVSAIAFNTSILDVFSSTESTRRVNHPGELIALCGMILPIAVAPVVIDRLTPYWSALHQLQYRFSAWRFSLAKPVEQIQSKAANMLWRFQPNTCYLNHGSFGAVPLVVRDFQRQLQLKTANQPMQMLAREMEDQWRSARFQLATWLHTSESNIAFCENATAGMNEIAAWFPIEPGDEVLLNDHEYGAVRRIWQRRCKSAGATLKEVRLPIEDGCQTAIHDAILNACNERTKLVIFSHITSPTAICLPVRELCESLRARAIASCIDGPHALLQESVNLNQLGCDFYTASCHKWLCGPIGSGFVYVAPMWHDQFRSARISWGRLPPKQPTTWSDELIWTGTRDYTAYLTLPTAIRFFQTFERERLDQRNHALARYARNRVLEIPETHAVTPDSRAWFGWMVGIWLPPGDHQDLQAHLQQRYGIEIPIVKFGERYLVRVSCHLYVCTADIDRLMDALKRELS